MGALEKRKFDEAPLSRDVRLRERPVRELGLY